MNNARSFRSIFMVASCAGAALGCYMVSLRVASERAALEDVETHIVLAQRDVRNLQTEIGTRGRLAQLERWNVRVLALSAPSADQFLDGSFALAKLTRPPEKMEIEAPVVLASAPDPSANQTAVGSQIVSDDGETGGALLHQASLKVRVADDSTKAVPARQDRVEQAKPKPAAPKIAAAKDSSPSRVATGAKPAAARTVDKKPTEKNAVVALKPVTHATKLAKADPLAPLADSKPGKSHAPTHRDTVSAR